MKNFMRVILYVGLIQLLANCGEGFRSVESVESHTTNTVTTPSNTSTQQGNQTANTFNFGNNSQYYDQFGNRIGQTAQSVDEQILQMHLRDMQGSEYSISQMSQSIKGFDLVVSSAGNNQFNISARLTFSCSETYTFESVVSAAQMQGRQTFLVGRDGSFELSAVCTDAGCRDMVAIIDRRSQYSRTKLLVGLAVAGSVDNNRILYVSRGVARTPYFASFPNTQQFEQANRCQVSGQQEQSFFNQFVQTGTQTLVETGFNLLGNWLSRQ